MAARGVVDQQGLYSVKTASIHFNHNPASYSHYSYLQRGESPNNNNNHHRVQTVVDFDASSTSQSVAQPQHQHQHTYVKNNSLKKLKKDLAMKKHIAVSESMSSSSLGGQHQAAFNVIDEDYLSRNELLLNPANVIASVV